LTHHVLSIHAHPDDAETLAGGTLALLASKGHRVTIATMTAGDCGSIEHGAEETAKIRKREAESAAKIIGAAYRCAGVRDLSVFNDDVTRRLVVELIRSLQPDIILTSAPADYHPDHEATSVLVRDACFAVSVPNYRAGMAPVLETIPHLYFMDPIEGRDREGNHVVPEFAVNVETFMETKRQMLSAHESQRSWVKKQHGIDNYVGAMEAWTRFRGKRFGVAYAEGFRQYTSHPYPRTELLQELSGDALLRADEPTRATN
jgi:LmbE family N-acetylglucosaminyl deacetylase